MSSHTRSILRAISFIGLLAPVAGCGDPEISKAKLRPPGSAHVYNGRPSSEVQNPEESQFLDQLRSIPPGQRQAYLQTHSATFEKIQQDPDKTKMAELQKLVGSQVQ